MAEVATCVRFSIGAVVSGSIPLSLVVPSNLARVGDKASTIDLQGHSQTQVARLGGKVYLPLMIIVFDIGDRARLRERFFGATFTVLARL